MKRFSVINICLCGFLPLVLLSACGGGGGGGDSSGTGKTSDSGSPAAAVTTLNGTVADGYLRNARVFLDRNRNRVYDNGEPQAQSGAGGVYTLEVNPGDGDTYPVVVDVVAGQTIDEDNGTTIVAGYQLETLPGHWQFVSPLTTLVSLELGKDPSVSEPQQAEISIRTRLGVSDTVSLFQDYISHHNVGNEQVPEFVRTHRAAQIVAAMLGSLRSAIAHNMGGTIPAAEQQLVAYMVSDQIVSQGELVKQALTAERNGGAAVDVAEVTTAISEGIDTESLDSDLLDRYEQRLEQNLPDWDMQPPQVVQLTPPNNDTASIDAVVSVTFDEALDETLLSAAIFDLSGPYGAVAGSLNYDADHFKLTFTPAQMLVPSSTYRVTIDSTLADTLGNPLGSELSWEFTTIFDQLPPPLPDF